MKGLLLLLIILVVLFIILYQRERFSGDYLLHRGPFEDKMAWKEEDAEITEEDKDEVQYDTSTYYREVQPSNGQVVLAKALDINHYVISDFPPQVKVDSTYNTDFVSFEEPDLAYCDKQYDSVTAVEEELINPKMITAYGELDVNSIYKNIELFKNRGGNVYTK